MVKKQHLDNALISKNTSWCPFFHFQTWLRQYPYCDKVCGWWWTLACVCYGQLSVLMK